MDNSERSSQTDPLKNSLLRRRVRTGERRPGRVFQPGSGQQEPASIESVIEAAQHPQTPLAELFAKDLRERAGTSQIDVPIQSARATAIKLAGEADVWIGGVPPMPFDDFVREIDADAPLTDRQASVFYNTNMNSAYSWVDPDRTLNEVVLLYGKGSGKDWLAAKVNAYVAYIACHLKGGPAHYYRTRCGLQLSRDTVLASLNVAPAGNLAVDTYFRYLLANLTHPLFAPFAPVIHAEEVLFCSPEELAVAKAQKRKPLPYFVLISKNSAASGLDGYNLISWVMDEADAFVNSDKKDNAKLIHGILRSSCATRMKNLWTGFVISYPRVKEGFMLTTYARAKKDMEQYGDKSQFYADLAATWDVRPGITRNDPTIRSEYEDDPDEAAARFECIPMESIDAFIEMPEKLDNSVERDRESCAYVTVDDYQETRRSGSVDYYVRARVADIRGVPGYEYFLGGDAGQKRDAYALSIWHTDNQAGGYSWICPQCVSMAPTLLTGARYELQGPRAAEPLRPGGLMVSCGVCMGMCQIINGSLTAGRVSTARWYKKAQDDQSSVYDAEGRAYSVGHVYEDLLVQIRPVRKGHGSAVNRSVHFPSVQTLCQELIERLPVAVSRFDPHQTAEITQGLRGSTGGDIDEISFSGPEQYRRAKLGKMMLYAGLLHFLPDEARDREWKRVRRINGNKIDHPDGPGESKDLFDAELICIWEAVHRKVGTLEFLNI